MSPKSASPIRVMRIISRMNVGGPAVQVSGLMLGLNSTDFDHRLYTGYCTSDEADYLDTVATDVNAVRIQGFGRRVSLGGDIKAFATLVKEIRKFKPHVVHTHTAKAGFLGRMASIVWGIMPSSAATTSTTISVTLAPRARIAVKASWPGVSIKVITPPSGVFT